MSKPINLDDLRAKAKAATPGPWEEDGRSVAQIGGDWADVVSCEVDCMAYCYGGTGRGVEHKPDAEFIAAANPAVVLALLDRLERAEKVIAVALSFVRNPHYQGDDGVVDGAVVDLILSRYEKEEQ